VKPKAIAPPLVQRRSWTDVRPLQSMRRVCPIRRPAILDVMIFLGVVLLIIAVIAKISILYTVGSILLVVGLVLLLLGTMDRAVGGRRHYY
jgi:membrane-bound ClpP family serine protease